MTDFILRYANEKDIEQILSIWKVSFGDEDTFVRSLLEDCGLLSYAVCAELDGKGRSFMFSFDGLSFGGRQAAYIYALCTEPAYRRRGLGKAVALYAAEMAAERGAKTVFLKPAKEELEKWYATSLGAVPFARTAVEIFRPSGATVIAEEISPEEYLDGRKANSLELPRSLILAQDCIHRHYGGGFFRCGDSFVCAEKRDDGIYVREFIGTDTSAALAAVAEKFAADELCLLRKSESGSPLMFIPPYFPSDDSLFMPFTLD